MKHPFKPSKSNIIYASIIAVLIIAFNIRIYGFNGYALGYSFGSIIGIILIPLFFAWLFWLILGRKEKGGTTTFNIVLTIMLIGMISEFGQIAKDKQKPVTDIQNAVLEYKENSKKNPDSVNSNYSGLSTNIKKGIDDLIKTSIGDEKRLYLVLKDYFKKADSINMEWNNSYNELMAPRILDFSVLNNTKEYDYQISVIQNYVKKSMEYREFVQNRVTYLKNNTRNLNQNNKALLGFMRGLKDKDSIQKPIFNPYINAHIAYGQHLTDMLKLLKKNNGKWKLENEAIVFKHTESQTKYDELLNNAIENEEIVNDLFDKLIDIM